MDAHALVIDTRPANAFAGGHVPGTLSIPLDRSFNTWAGWLLPYDRDVYLIVLDDTQLDAAVRDLAMIGLDRVGGHLRPEALTAWTTAGHGLETTPQMSIGELVAARAAGRVSVVDVRGASEWERGHLPGVVNVPLGYLAERTAELPSNRPLVVHCETGARSAIATSVLQLHGRREAINLVGGFAAWRHAGQPTERGVGRLGMPELATAHGA
jgi:hydroxyacylglutathione hydrolase